MSETTTVLQVALGPPRIWRLSNGKQATFGCRLFAQLPAFSPLSFFGFWAIFF